EHGRSTKPPELAHIPPVRVLLELVIGEPLALLEIFEVPVEETGEHALQAAAIETFVPPVMAKERVWPDAEEADVAAAGNRRDGGGKQAAGPVACKVQPGKAVHRAVAAGRRRA